MKFFSELLAEGYDLRLQVTGASMSPFIKSGSYVTLFKIPVSKLRIGDIIFCCCDDGAFKLHRLIKISDNKLVTKGDALHAFDFPFDKNDYKGKVIGIEPFCFCGMDFHNMDPGFVRWLNFLIAKYQQIKSHLIFMVIGLRSKLMAS
ncbi:MAG: S24/S26 family peptidase [Desulfobacteraceae bacterium]|nr:S24/S26 family peptidase [Desulfobacteraceae bacterium]